MINDDPHFEDIQKVVKLMRSAHRLLVITGSGLSADSGLPTYRGIGGLYENRSTIEGISIEEALSGPMMREQPEITWKYILQIARSCQGAQYNRGHSILAQMEDHFDSVCILTQNVDGFHKEAGSTNVIDIHGDVHDIYCIHCRYSQYVSDFNQLDIPPQCPNCNHILRPDVVLFGEMLAEQKIRRLYTQLTDGFDMIFSIGTTSGFPYIAQPVIAARTQGVPTVEINPLSTEVTPFVQIKLASKAAITLETLWDTYTQKNFKS